MLTISFTDSIIDFFQKNQGEFIGAILGVLGGATLALFGTWLTINHSQKQKRKEAKADYLHNLFNLHVELFWRSHQINLLRKSLSHAFHLEPDEIRNLSSHSFTTFNLTIFDQIISKIFNAKDSNEELRVHLISYNALIRLLNANSNLEPAIRLINSKNDKFTAELFQSYLNTFENEYLNKTQMLLTEIQLVLKNQLETRIEQDTLFDLFFKELPQEMIDLIKK